jgi:acetyl-CoA C-acetyltransferase
MQVKMNPTLPVTVSPRFEASLNRKVLPGGGVAEAFDDVVIVGGARTPFAKIGGSFREIPSSELMLTAMRGALEKTGAESKDINQVIAGNEIMHTSQAGFAPRNAGASIGMPNGTIAHRAGRQCGTGFELIRQAAQQMTDGGDSLVMTVGTENMSRTPVLDDERMLVEEYAKAIAKKGGWTGKLTALAVRFTKLRKPKPYTNPLMQGLTNPQAEIMIGTADTVANQSHITRQQADAFAAMSQQRVQEAVKAGRFQEEIRPVRKEDLSQGRLPKGVTEVINDEHPRKTDASKLAKLAVELKNREDAIHTAGNSSGVVDGAAAVLVSTGLFAQEKNLPILAKIRSVAVTGCDPKVMGIGPVRAIPAALEAAGVKLDQVDLFEINEAFAGQALACANTLGVPMEKLNVDGGAIALGHPIAATGERITLHAAHRLKQDGNKFAVVSACIGDGQGIAMVLENPQA